MNEDVPLEICVRCVRSIAVLALVWPDSVVGSARQSPSVLLLISTSISPLMHHQRFLPTKLLPTLNALELLHQTVRHHVVLVVRLRVHGKSTDVALISFDSQVDDIQMVDNMRFVFESAREGGLNQPSSESPSIIIASPSNSRQSTTIASERPRFNQRFRLMLRLLMIQTFGSRVELLEAVNAVEARRRFFVPLL
jgi:hypothetical protein